MTPTSFPWPRVGRLRRYGPVGLIVVALVAFGTVATVERPGNSPVAGGPGRPATGAIPITFAVAKSDGTVAKYRWGPECDRTTGRVKMPTLYAPDCVPVWRGRDNGGATWNGVSAAAINVVYYLGPPGGLAAAVQGATSTNAETLATAQAFVAMFNKTSALYGRQVNLIPFNASGSGSDTVAAQADAVRVANQLHAFASIGGPAQTNVYSQELARLHVLCIACGTFTTAAALRQGAPYLWVDTPAIDSLLNTAVTYVIDQLNGKKAIWAGEASFRRRKRLFEVVDNQANPPNPDGLALANEIRDRLRKAHANFVSDQALNYQLDLTTLPDQAATIAAKLKEENVTTIVFAGDPIMPIYLTRAAAKIDYYPEWVITGTILTDTSTLGRYYDQTEWAHAFGVSALPVPLSIDSTEAYRLYSWWFGAGHIPPAAKTASTILPAIQDLFEGLELAGPTLTPSSFRSGLFAAPPVGGGPTAPVVAYGAHGAPPTPSYASPIDYTFVWWSSTARGPDEEGTQGTGLMEHVQGGRRYRLGTVPSAPVEMFRAESSVTSYRSPPPSSAPPSYPPWPGSPAARG